MTQHLTFYGPPGTGKTTELIAQVRAAIAAGTDPRQPIKDVFHRYGDGLVTWKEVERLTKALDGRKIWRKWSP